MMGEQPIFTTKAHVFQIDPGTKKKWLPSCSQAINVSYYYDSIRNTYRIISVDGSKAIINSTITLTMAFTKTSQKFGQWTDHQANTVYGLGFSSEGELNKFIDKFKEVKELMKSQGDGPHKPAQTNGTADSNHSTPDKHNMSNSNQHLHITDLSTGDAPSPSLNSTSPALAGSSNVSVVDQLKYENDRLKLALAQSSANAKKWEVELQTLKNNNVRLTTALQESTTNVEEWKRQLAAYKEESARMKKKVLDMEQGSGGGSELLQRQLSDLRDKMVDSERSQTAKQQEVDALTRRLDSLHVVEKKNTDLADKIKHLEEEKAALQRQNEEMRRRQDEVEVQRVRDRQQLLNQQQHIAKLSTELHDASNKMADILRSQSRS